MLRLTDDQQADLDRHWIASTKREIVKALGEFSRADVVLTSVQMEEFVRRSMESARAVWIDTPVHMLRFSKALFHLSFVERDELKLQQFSQAMLSESNAEARLKFVENHLLDDTRR